MKLGAVVKNRWISASFRPQNDGVPAEWVCGGLKCRAGPLPLPASVSTRSPSCAQAHKRIIIPNLPVEVLPLRLRPQERFVHFRRYLEILIHHSRLKFNLQNFALGFVTYRPHGRRLHWLSLHPPSFCQTHAPDSEAAAPRSKERKEVDQP